MSTGGRHRAGAPRRLRLAGGLAVGGGLAFLVTAWIGATNPTFHGEFESTVEYVNDASALAALLLTIPGVVALRWVQGAPSGALEMAVAGQLLLVVGIAAGIVLGEDPSWFAAVGVPANLLWLVGTVRLGRHTWRVGLFPRSAAVGIALTVPVGLVLGEFGGSALPGVVWLYLGLRLMAPATRRVAASAAAT